MPKLVSCIGSSVALPAWRLNEDGGERCSAGIAEENGALIAAQAALRAEVDRQEARQHRTMDVRIQSDGQGGLGLRGLMRGFMMADPRTRSCSLCAWGPG